MSSRFDAFAKGFVAPALQEHFGERDEQGALATLEVHEPNRNQPVKLTGVIVGQLRANDFDEDIDGTRTSEKITDIVELTIPRTQNEKSYAPEIGSLIALPEYGEGFTFKEIMSETAAFVTVRTERPHIAKKRQTTSERT